MGITISSVLTILDLVHSAVISLVTGYITSFPPSVHSVVVKAYDYPIARVLLYASILVTALYAPVTAILYGVGIAIMSEDIMKSSKAVTPEAFRSGQDDLRESLKIQVAKHMSPIEEALEKVKQAEHLLRQNISSRRG